MQTSAEGNTRAVVRRFASHEEQEEADLRYWLGQPLTVKLEVVAELARYFAEVHHVDLDAQGPKRFVARAERA